MRFRLLSILVALTVLVGCGGTTAPTGDQPTAGTQATAATQPTAGAPATGDATQPTAGEKVTLTIESWRNDDLTIWQDTIIPAFEAKHPNIDVVFAPTAPTEYNAALNSKLAGGSAGDLITCRPFDVSLGLHQQGYLAGLADLPGLESFSDVAKSAWITDDGQTPFCVPMASVIHGFIYNQEAFDKLGITAPKTQDEFLQALEKIKQDGTYIPLALGTAEQWEAATMGFQNIGPDYWKGEEGRQALIKGTAKFTDAPYVDTFKALAAWKPYLPPGYEAQKYADSQSMFTLGRAAIYPAGSWEIGLFNQQAQFKMGAFPPPAPAAGGECYISDHTDIGMGMNAASKHPAEARTFLEWMTTAEFATLYSNALPGFFSLSNHSITLSDPLAQQFLSWRQSCKSTIRNSYQILSRGEPNLENELWRLSAGVLNGSVSPEQAAQEAQAGLDKWYKPAQ
ncbi:MAG TPA: ABC transporter substrate-binding protein [Roseiflexaceae bacterium]|nr:ABC transporter substrate-binding protein [Roseiflexaceae bacterium]